MKPCSRKVKKTGNLLQEIGFGSKNTVASIKGSTKKLGVKYKDALVVIYNKTNLQPLAVRKSDVNGEYLFSDLNNSLNCFAICINNDDDFNALIFDNLIPK